MRPSDRKWIEDAMLECHFEEGGMERPGLDCYGFCRLFLLECCGVYLPKYEVFGKDRHDIVAHDREKFGVECLFCEPQRGHMVFLDYGPQRPIHMGVYVDSATIYHCDRFINICQLNLTPKKIEQSTIFIPRGLNG